MNDVKNYDNKNRKFVKELQTIEIRNRKHVVLCNVIEHVNPIKIFFKKKVHP